MTFLRNVLSRNALRPVWWSTFETVTEAGGAANIVKAIADADHNVKVTARAFAKVSFEDLQALRDANEAYEQAKYDRAILDNLYDDTYQY